MPHIDITIDFETCGLSVDAAPLQLAAVAWRRSVDQFDTDVADPFIKDATFNMGIDARDCFMLGLTFDRPTQHWWQKQSLEVRDSVISILPYPLADVLDNFIKWVKTVTADSTSYTIWAQGSDFDIARLNHYLQVCGIKAPWHHTQVRCARTYILEHFCLFSAHIDDAFRDPSKIYDSLPALPKYISDELCHNALYDCYRTSWDVWQVWKKLTAKSVGL